jgi:hypothetical protein
MESRTFHLFPLLPKELRDAIWDFAIRPEGPSAHFFTVFESSNDAEWSLLSQHAMRHPLAERCCLAAPHARSDTSDDNQEKQFSWVRGNRSAYLIDSGLWTACTESRDAMERRFKLAECDIKSAAMPLERPAKNLLNLPVTELFQVTPNGEWRRCLTRADTDLFLLRPFNSDTVEWECVRTPMPIFDRADHFYASHIALDYDPEWLTDGNYLDYWSDWVSPKSIGCAIRAATDQLHWAKKLWFVDYRIRRRPDALPTTTGRHQFYGHGCTFTEVREGDADWEVDHSKNIFRFLEELYKQVLEYCDDIEENSPARASCFDSAPYVCVLAYEERGPSCCDT